MIVTEIEDCGSGKRKVYLDGQPAFVLYRGELSGCHIEKDQELPEAVYREIMDEILWKRDPHALSLSFEEYGSDGIPASDEAEAESLSRGTDRSGHSLA